MKIEPSLRVASLGGYAFAEIDLKVAELQSSGTACADFGVGDPRDPTPEHICRRAREAVMSHRRTGYPSYVGSAIFREAVAAWLERRFGVALDPEREVSSTIGSKEAVFHFPLALLNPGDLVLAPSPGYPPYARGTMFAGGETYFYPLAPENGFLPDLQAIPREIVSRAKILWLCHPNAPTGTVLPPEFLAEVVEFARRNEIVLASDEAYSEIWFGDEPPQSALQFGSEGIIAFHSLSKRSAMTGWRVGFVAGDERLVALFKKVKTNIDSGTPNFIQEAAVAALSDETHVAAMRASYRRKGDLLLAALAQAGLVTTKPEATLYLWQRAPEGMSGLDLATRLLAPEVAVVTIPGASISTPTDGGGNPGERYVRFALVPEEEAIRAAAARIAKLDLRAPAC